MLKAVGFPFSQAPLPPLPCQSPETHALCLRPYSPTEVHHRLPQGGAPACVTC